MNTAEDVADHIYGRLLDLRRTVDTSVAIAVARAMIDGANRAIDELSLLEGGAAPEPKPEAFSAVKH
jgi:hypothetical protein